MNSNRPLMVELFDGELIIHVGARTLAKAIEQSPGMTIYDPDFNRSANPKITDPYEFAKDIITVLEDYDDEGETLLTVALESAAFRAIDAGSEHVILPDEKGYGENNENK